ncbi:NAD(P)-binding protein [Armillaria gallica]|uniref:NAD(P)-binding protein n=1 Tax=Armillaria gallica TaxID=47427 RepID=A0A2H3DVE9_ARMGA|nr:NAD(P)-binding protein [Armillaria gallica]
MSDSNICKIADEKLLSHSARVKDKVLLITGGASGIGKATALQFAAHGAKVVIGDRNVDGAQATVDEIVQAGGLATCISCDVSAWDDVVALFELAMRAYGAIDVVVSSRPSRSLCLYSCKRQAIQGRLIACGTGLDWPFFLRFSCPEFTRTVWGPRNS